jgi:hypothetical protein
MADGSMDSARKHQIMHNAMGLVNAYGWPWQEALEIALDQNQPLFSKRLRIKRAGGTSGGRGPSQISGPGGGHDVGSGPG